MAISEWNNINSGVHNISGNKVLQNTTDFSCLKIYKLIISKKILELIVTETNKYAHQFISIKTLKKSSRIHNDIENFLLF